MAFTVQKQKYLCTTKNKIFLEQPRPTREYEDEGGREPPEDGDDQPDVGQEDREEK